MKTFRAMFKKANFSREFFVLLAIVVLAVFLRTYKLQESPIFVDEATFISFERDMISSKVSWYEPLADYFGDGIAYVFLPTTLLFGPNIFFLRFTAVLFSAASIFLLYFFTKRLYNKKVALFSCFILAISTSDFFISTEFWELPVINFFIILFLYSFARYSETRNKYYFFLIAFVIGFATITNPIFLFFLASFLITFRLNSFISFLKFRRSLTKKIFFVGFLFFFLGIFQMLYWNLLNNFATLKFIINHVPVTADSKNLFDIRGNLSQGYFNFINFLDNGSNFGILQFVKHLNSIMFLSYFLLFLMFTFEFAVQSKKIGEEKKDIYILLNFVLIILFLSLLTITTFRYECFCILLPFYSIIIGSTAVHLIDSIKKWKMILTFFVILSLSLGMINLLSGYDQLIESRKTNLCNQVIEGLVKFFNNSSNSTLVFDISKYEIFYGFYNETKNLSILRPHYAISSQLPELWANLIQNKNNEYVFVSKLCLSPWATNLNIYENFVSFVNANHKKLILEAIVSSNDEELFRVVRVS